MTEYLDRYPTMHEYSEGKRINPKLTDLISRADAIEAVCRTRCGDKAKGCPAHSCLVIEEFDALPSAEAVHGEWIKHKGEWKDFDFYPTKYECSQCHYCVDEGYDSIFCPNCGARMKGGADK